MERSFSSQNELGQAILKWFSDLNPVLGLCWGQTTEPGFFSAGLYTHLLAEVRFNTHLQGQGILYSKENKKKE